MVTHDGVRRVQTAPAGDAGAEAQFGIVGVSEEIFIKAPDLPDHVAPVESGAAVGPEGFLDSVELAVVELAGAAATVLAVGVDEMAALIDLARIFPDEDLRRDHADGGVGGRGFDQSGEPVGVGFGIVIEQGEVFPACYIEALIIGRAEAFIVLVAEDAQGASKGRREAFEKLQRAVRRAIINDDNLKWFIGLEVQRTEALMEELAPVPVDYNHADRG